MARSRSWRPWFLIALLCAAGSVVVWLLAGERELERALARERSEAARQLVPPARLVEELVLEPQAVEPVLARPKEQDLRPTRALGNEPPPPDALAALRGVVLDEKTREPLRSMRLTLLSRRPKTCAVQSDDDGAFATGAELATGVIAVMHVPDPSDPRYDARFELEPSEFLLPPVVDGAPPHEIVLLAKRPQRVLEIDVTMPDGTRADGASVALTIGTRQSDGLFVPEARDWELADHAGRAHFALFGPDTFTKSFRVEAEHQGTLASEVIELDPPLDLRPRVVELWPGGVLRVTARNDDGKPVPGVSLWLSTNLDGRWQSGKKGDTDARGECLFTALKSACYTVNAIHPLSGKTQTKEVELARGAQAEVEFHMTVANLALGVAGKVVDENGYPLPGIAVRIHAPSEEPVELESGAGGVFEYWGRATSALMLGFGTGFLDDRFDPSVFSVPFGTTGVEVRRSERAQTRTMPIKVVDRATNRFVPGARIVLYHARALFAGAPSQDLWKTENGIAQLEFKLREDTRYCVDAPGYLRQEGALAALVEEAGQTAPLLVLVERGFERTVEVRDRITQRLLPGARFQVGASELAQSDEKGVARLRAADWPPALRVECTGFEALVWDPLEAPFPGTTVWLEPTRVK